MALLTAQEIDLDGLNVAFTAAAAGGDTFLPDDRTVLRVLNGAGAPITVTVATPGTAPGGLAIADSVTSVTNGQERSIGPFPTQQFADPATGLASITYSSATSVTVALSRIPARA